MAKTHVFCILDKSGSMGFIEKATIDGYNDYIGGLKKTKGALFHLTLFDTVVDQRIKGVNIKDVAKLDKDGYRPDGMTALYDAVCETLAEAKDKVGEKDKALVVIITDGQENSSREYTEKNMARLVEELQSKGNWTFTYLGANQDAWATASQWGFKSGNVATFNATSAGATAAFSAMSASSVNYVNTRSMSATDSFYADDADKLKDTK
jgi:hypothetical protein